MPIYRVQAPNGKIYKVEGPENADPNTLFGFVQQQVEAEDVRRLQKEYGPGILQTFGRATKRGFQELGSLGTDIIPAMAGSALGFDEYAKEQMAEAAAKRAAREAEAPTVFRSYKEVEGLGDVPKFVAETIGEQVANIGTALIPGLGLGALATRGATQAAVKSLAAEAAERGLVGTAAEQFVAQGLKAAAPQIAARTATGQNAGIFLGSYAQNAPEVFQNIYENTGELAPGAGALFGIASAALDSVLPATLAKNLTGPAKAGIVEKVLEKSGMDKGLLRSVTAGTITGIPAEGLTEGAQEAISIFAEKFVADNPQVFESKEWDRIMEAAVKGAVAGGAFGGLGGAAERAKAASERRQAYADALERRGQRQQAAEVRRQDAEIMAMQDQEAQMALPGMEMGPATGLYRAKEVAPEVEPKELKGKQAELFTPEGELTPAVEKAATRDEKIEANKQRLAAQRGAAEVKEAQAKLKKFLSSKQATLPGFDAESLDALESQVADQRKAQAEQLQAAEAMGQSDLFAPPVTQTTSVSAPLEAQPTTTPTVTPQVQPAPSLETMPTAIGKDSSGLKTFGKMFGIGPTARILREDGPLAGKDISNPEDAAEVKRVLEAYASGKPATGAAEKIDTYLKRPEFQGVTDVTAQPVEQPSGAGAGVVGEPVAGAAPGVATGVEPSGVVPAPEDVGQPAVGEGAVAAPVEAAPEVTAEAPAPAPTPTEVVEAAPAEPGKKAKTDLAKAERGREESAQQQANFLNEVDENANSLLVSRLRELGRDAGLKDVDLPAENYRGTEAHNILRLPYLFAQHNDSMEMLRESMGTPQEQKNRDQIQQIEEAIARSGPEAVQVFQQLQGMSPKQQTAYISEINRVGRQMFDEYAQNFVSKTKAEQTEKPEAKLKKAEPTEAELDAMVEDFNKKFFEKTGRKLFSPSYQGPAFDADQQRLAQAGDVNGLLRNLIDKTSNPVIKQILRRIRSLNLNTRVVIAPVEGGQAGSYDPATNTITLDPTNGLNAHTFIHEVVHAAISNVLANPSHPLTKAFQQFFIQIQDRLGAAYGAQDLQEFAAELVGNPEFQAILRSIKAPRSESLFRRIMETIAEFFGFKGKSAFDQGVNFINDAINISGDVEPVASQKMFLGTGAFPAVGRIGQSMPSLTGAAVDRTKNFFSNIKDVGALQAGLGMLRLDNLNTIYGKELPSLQKLIDALEKRNGTQEQRIKTVNENYKRFTDVQKKFPQAMERMGDMAIDARLAEVDLLNPNFQPTNANLAEYNRLQQIYRSLPKEVQDVYRTMRKDYDRSLGEYRNILLQTVSPSLAQKLSMEFQNLKGVTGYVPFLRHGDFWVEYADPQTGERAASAFESTRERQQFIDTVLTPQRIQHRAYQNLQSISYDAQGIPPTSFIGRVMSDLQKQGADQSQLDSVYQAYLTLFPGESILKQFMKAKNVRGMERDMVRNYGDIMVRWSRKLANSEYMPQINKALGEIAVQGERSGSLQVEEAAKGVLRQGDFFRNPTYGSMVNAAVQFSYFEYIAGNISSALINVTSLPMLVWPLLSGKFGFGETSSAMMAASRTIINGLDKNPRYKNLYQTLMDHGQLEHTISREVLEGRRQTTGQYFSLYGKMMDALSIPFSATERYNRGVTAVAAYDLAKGRGMSEEKAIRYALNTVKDIHTSGMAATAPRWMQHPVGRVFFTFKSFVWNSAFVVARAFYNAYKGETPEVRRAAQRQLIGMYGMTMAFAGVKGMPFYGAASTLATMLNAMFGDDEPFDFDEEMRRFFGELFYKGFFNYITNIELANRAGIATDLIYRDDPRGVAEHGYVLSAMQQAFGPLGSYLVNAERGINAMADGQVMRGVESLLPSWLRNGLKGARYMTEGATTLKGDPVVEDVSAYNSLMQVIGFAPANLSTTYEKLSAAKAYEREINSKRAKLLDRYNMANEAGDFDMREETKAMIREFNEVFPAKKITQETLAKSVAGRKAAEKQMINGVRFDKSLMPEIQEKFFSDEEEE
jgi:hypothetical protein